MRRTLIRILLNGPQDARPGKNRFAYAESPAKQRRDRDVPDTAHNPNELGRICILLAGVYRPNPRGNSVYHGLIPAGVGLRCFALKEWDWSIARPDLGLGGYFNFGNYVANAVNYF